MGFQFCLGRKLIPTSYSIQNRFSNHEVMLSWRFEASNDMVHWTLLDTRYHNLHTPDAIDALCKKGGTTTWGIEA